MMSEYTLPDEYLRLHEVSMVGDILFRCVICGETWLFNPLMFRESTDPETLALVFCPGTPQKEDNV